MAGAYQVVRDFEKEVAHWAGAKYGIAVESCCAAIFLSSLYVKSELLEIACIPEYTYPGVGMALRNAGYRYLTFREESWEGIYEITPLKIIDSALRFKKDMYIKDSFYCLSFHYKKLLPIGRGGMILTNDKEAVEWLKMARFDGRREMPLSKDNASIIGWNMYMEPSQAARGLALFETVKNKNLPDLKVKEQHYPNLTKWRCFNE